MTDTYSDPFAAEVDEETRELATVIPQDFDADDNRIVFCSIDTSNREDALRVYNIVAGSSAALADVVGTEIEVSDLVAHAVKLVSAETGEVQDLIRTILVSPDGAAYSAVSVGVVNCLKKLTKIIGPAPWNPPIILIPKQVRTAANRQVLLLEAKNGKA